MLKYYAASIATQTSHAAAIQARAVQKAIMIYKSAWRNSVVIVFE
jgi:hypothetical protein